MINMPNATDITGVCRSCHNLSIALVQNAKTLGYTFECCDNLISVYIPNVK